MSGGRYGIDIAMVRRAPNNLVYVSEKRYGLPLVIDPTSNRVLGQTGVSHGALAGERTGVSNVPTPGAFRA